MATDETRDAGDSTLLQREETRSAEGLDTALEASEEALAPGTAPFSMSVAGNGSSLEEQVRHCGRFTLARGARGVCWILTSKCGSVWYWHPEDRRWIASCRAYCTEEEATAGLDEILAHEQAGDLDEQHALVENLLPDRVAEI